MKGFNKPLFAHVILAVAASSFTGLTFTLTDLPVNFTYLILVFFAALLIYRLAYFGLPFNVHTLKLVDRLILSVSLVIVIITALYIEPLQRIMLAGCFFACMAYFTKFKKWNGLRSLILFKSIWVALIWTIVTVWIPLKQITEYEMFLLAERFVFMLSICIIYNLRDYQYDSNSGIHTLLHSWGVTFTKVICLLLLFMFQFLILQHQYPEHIYNALSVSMALTGLMIIMARKNGHWLYYSLLTDGSMILQFLLVEIAVHKVVD